MRVRYLRALSSPGALKHRDSFRRRIVRRRYRRLYPGVYRVCLCARGRAPDDDVHGTGSRRSGPHDHERSQSVLVRGAVAARRGLWTCGAALAWRRSRCVVLVCFADALLNIKVV